MSKNIYCIYVSLQDHIAPQLRFRRPYGCQLEAWIRICSLCNLINLWREGITKSSTKRQMMWWLSTLPSWLKSVRLMMLWCLKIGLMIQVCIIFKICTTWHTITSMCQWKAIYMSQTYFLSHPGCRHGSKKFRLNKVFLQIDSHCELINQELVTEDNNYTWCISAGVYRFTCIGRVWKITSSDSKAWSLFSSLWCLKYCPRYKLSVRIFLSLL